MGSPLGYLTRALMLAIKVAPIAPMVPSHVIGEKNLVFNKGDFMGVVTHQSQRLERGTADEFL